MLRHVTALICVLLIVAPYSFSQKQSYSFVSKDGSFSAEFPSKPLEFTFGPEITNTDREMHLVIFERGDATFVISYSELESAPLDSKAIELVLNYTRDDALISEGKDARLLNETSIEISGFRAREIRVKRKDKYGDHLQTMRIVVVKQRVYKVAVDISSETFDVSEADRFFASFKLLTK